MRARNNAVVGVVVALVIAGIAYDRRRIPAETRAVETTRAVRIVRRDSMALPEKKGLVRDPVHVRALTEALGVDVHPVAECPPDYAEAELGIILSGNDVYARRNVYVFGMVGDRDASPSTPSVVSVTSAGCRVGPPADLAILRRELVAAGVLE
ncbi:MAG: hypothetical protein QOI41_508 [Myxococcales bacterium]|jgi:hypothetical protein|nr:hypothetical protein [Myxococcales bacterium]